MNFEVFKEPRGLMRLIQLLFAIIAFATTSGYKSSLTFNATCKPYTTNATTTASAPISRTINIAYPFNMANSAIEPLSCLTTFSTVAPGLNYPYGSYTSSAQFYVFVGVMAFLYCIGITVVYVFFDQVYTDNELVPQIDFIVTAVWTLFWFIGSVAWAVGVSFLKLETSADRLWHQITQCLPNVGSANCSVTEGFGFGGLDISLICGFANVFLWGASLWFLFKETVWFKRMHPEQAYGDQQQQAGAPGGSDFKPSQQPGGVETGAGLH